MQSVTCKGFTAAGIRAGIKESGLADLALIYSQVPAAVAGVFTTNFVKSPSVLLDMERVAAGRCRAVVVNSGNANCCTGEKGMADARRVTALCAEALGVEAESVLVGSTGVIGRPLPMDRITAAVPELSKALRVDGFEDFSRAILTTDTVPKLLSRQGDVDGVPYRVVAAAKGAGMIRPNMATMLCFVCTDAAVAPDMLNRVLKKAVEGSLNRISIDGDTSTNDTALILANGASGARVASPSQEAAFQKTLDELLLQIARDLVRDGEGVTKLVEIVVMGAQGREDARRIADTIGHSPLVKTALFGEDANWGRIVAAAGRAGVAVDADRMRIAFDDVTVFENGVPKVGETDSLATAVLKRPEFTITVDLGSGRERHSIITCDFSLDYVRINADYRT